MIINHNMNAMNAHRNMGMNTVNSGKSMEKLSSGLRINRAGDDAAGLAISEKMRGQIRGLDQATRNSQDSISMIQTAEGALNETHSILQRMRELGVQSANDTNVEKDRSAIQDEMNQLAREITRISETTEFNTQNLLDGKLETKFQIGANADQNITLKINAMDAKSLGVVGLKAKETKVGDIAISNSTDEAFKVEFKVGAAGSSTSAAIDKDGKVTVTLSSTNGTDGTAKNSEIVAALKAKGIDAKVEDAKKDTVVTADVAETSIVAATELSDGDSNNLVGISVSTQKAANKAITSINDAINTVSTERSNLGAYQNRLEHTINNLNTSSENLQASESRIRDVDMAKEMMAFSKNNILSQAAQAMLAQANQQPQGVLQLLR
ncbi:flagellin [Clostridium botulinum]|uniref:flagellin N-terminal helical domain-containing protein n=1 Tax=Clostridium botulinum TaxID=1491 RepID=UPI000773FAA6|nr:flagellin [Clostridium botulinum]MBN1072539.1 flagellin [Clostridium botulinum]NFH81191.1 flagellin [Clostridium botulinum]NFH84249.1 flagellin [Clostridium botulinum]NFI12494.1 flagellin [Clostridium botulinum]NFI15377.1 flagellin [Clostridium botulinum]